MEEEPLVADTLPPDKLRLVRTRRHYEPSGSQWNSHSQVLWELSKVQKVERPSGGSGEPRPVEMKGVLIGSRRKNVKEKKDNHPSPTGAFSPETKRRNQMKTCHRKKKSIFVLHH